MLGRVQGKRGVQIALIFRRKYVIYMAMATGIAAGVGAGQMAGKAVWSTVISAAEKRFFIYMKKNMYICVLVDCANKLCNPLYDNNI